jgi:glycosyltransferase involved in cell wall biosynthesis
MNSIPDVSIVVPLYNEEENVSPLVAELDACLEGGPRWELVLVDDGSSDHTALRMAQLAGADPRLTCVYLVQNYGQTAALQAGFDHALGRAVVTMDGDLQNDPRDIPRMLERLDDGYDLVVGYRENRQDRAVTRRFPSWVANRMISRITGVRIRDNGCSLKAFRGDLVRDLHLYSDMHRFISPLAVATAGARLTEMPVNHRARMRGESKYGLARIWKVTADLLTLAMINRFRERPLLMFAWGAITAAAAGVAFALAASIAMASFGETKAVALVFPGASLLCFGLACFLLMLGVIGEVAVRGRLGRSGARLAVER